MLVVTRVFGHVEFLLLIAKAKKFVMSFALWRQHHGDEELMRLQGTKEWEHLWRTLTEFAERFDLSQIRLNLNLHNIHEEFHAQWERRGAPDIQELWRCDIPLHLCEIPVGKVSLAGVCRAESACEWMGELIAGLKPFELQLIELLEEHIPQPDAGAVTTELTMSGAVKSVS
jgi:UDP-GlcNAc:undecaprenyl-phosphate GlcNAc-1-phosphate transferase